jgi:catechol 2,3-dioxygenase-like lactoylglutathione lyase family enzyme
MADPHSPGTLHGGPLIHGKAVPTLPARDLEVSILFYARLGFRVAARYQAFGGPYAVLAQGDVELHLFQRPALDPGKNEGGCYLRVADARALHAALYTAGIEGLGTLKDRPWGVREFALVDPSGNLVRMGQTLRVP